MKGHSGMYVVKAVAEKIKKFDSKALAAALHGAHISVKDYPGVLLDVSFDKNGDLDRDSFLVKVENGKQVVTERCRPSARSRRRERGHRVGAADFCVRSILNRNAYH